MRLSLQCFAVAAVLLVIDATAQTPLIGVTNTAWRYLTTGVDPGEDWKHPEFDDGSWPTGRGLFGNESNYPYPMNTPVLGPSGGGPLTAYYRTRFQWQGSVAGITFFGTNYVDDGCVIYLNGVELTRFNMPSGDVTYSTLALGFRPEPVSVLIGMELSNLTNGNANPLVEGENVLAVEVHQNSSGSGDHVFGLTLGARPNFPCGIIDHPASQVATACQTVTFTVASNPDCFNPSYQWFFEPPGGQASPLFGANQSILTLPAVQVDHVGYYFCRVTSINGTLDSQWASLGVLQNLTAPAVRFAYRDEANNFHIIFDRAIRSQGADIDLQSWRVYPFQFPPGPDLNIISVQLTNENEVVLQTAEVPNQSSSYAFETTLDIASLCGDGVLPAGALGFFSQLTSVIDFGDLQAWQYLDTGIDPGPDWKGPSFDDSSWKSGRQVFSTLPSANEWTVNSLLPRNSPVPPDQRIPSYLFRFRWNNCNTPFSGAIAQVLQLGGVVIYVNGHEVYRRGIADDQFGSSGGSTHNVVTVEQPIHIDSANFILGDNVIAVLLKPSHAGTGHATFGLRLSTPKMFDHIDWGPSIVEQPESVSVVEGRRWSMQVVDGPCGPGPRYQWYRNGVPLPGANWPTLTGVAKPADEGIYHVVLDGFGSVQSSNATLHVEPATLSYRASWRYQTNSQDATLSGIGAPWFAPQFDDSGWAIGEGPFARETSPSTLARMPSPIATPLPAPDPSFQTTYFRTLVTIPEVPAGQTLVLCHTIDDGAAIYIDGQLAHRYNLTNALPIYSTNAAAMNSTGDNDAQIVCTPLTLTPGEHLIAVEVHQANPDQSDILFGLELRIATPPTDLAIKSNSAGNYFLQWTTDPFWDLVESTQIAGPYSRVSGNGASPYSLPPASTNRFYQLRFHGR